MTDRERYEVWLANNVRQLASVSEPEGDFLIWQAATRETAQRCTAICEAEAKKWEVDGAGPEPMSRLCAAHIRREFGL